MVRNVVVTIIVICQLFAVAACAQKVVAEPASKPQVQAENTDTFVYGRVSLEPTEKIEQYQPVVDYLAVRLGEHGIGVGQVKVAPDAETMALWLANGEVDLFNDSFFVTEYVSNHSGAVPIVYREKGKPNKHAVFVTSVDSGLDSLADLAGNILAVEEFDSTSGFMLPIAHLLEAGMNPVEKAGPISAVAADEVGYVFAGDDDVVVRWVAGGEVSAGSIDNETYEEFNEANPGRLKILDETESVVRDQVVLVRADMDAALQDTVVTLLLEMEQTEEGQFILEEVVGAKRFSELSEAKAAGYARAREMYELVYNR